MHHNYRTFCLLVASSICLFLAGPATAEDLPKATFTAKGPNGQAIAIKFDDKGKMTVLRDEEEIVTCEYKVEKDQITFSNETGPRGNKDAKPGTYRWKLDGKKLSFTKVSDDHEGRARAITAVTWEKKD